MTTARRALIAVALMSLGLVALVIDALENGWSVLAGVGIACFALAIVAQLVALGRPGATH